MSWAVDFCMALACKKHNDMMVKSLSDKQSQYMDLEFE